MERKMRRFRQLLADGEAKEILRRGKYCVMAVAGDDGYPYAVPVNYVYDGDAVYIHCAKSGHKTDALRRQPKCSLCVIDRDDVVPEEFTSYFRSVIAFGRAGFVEDRKEKISALRMLGAKYSPGIDPTAEIDRLIGVVDIIRINLDCITGKEAIELRRERD